MFGVRLAGDHLCAQWMFTWLSLVISLMLPFLCCPFSHEISWMRSGTELSEFLRIFCLLLIGVVSIAQLVKVTDSAMLG